MPPVEPAAELAAPELSGEFVALDELADPHGRLASPPSPVDVPDVVSVPLPVAPEELPDVPLEFPEFAPPSLPDDDPPED